MAAEQTLAQIADYLDAELVGDPSCQINGLGSLANATAGQVSFLLSSKYLSDLKSTGASAVILQTQHQAACPTHVLLMDDPKMGYAKLADLFKPTPTASAGVHPSAVIGDNCQIDPSATIGANCVIGANVTIGAKTQIGSGSSIGADCVIGANCHLYANVTFYHGVNLGDHSICHSGVVIGADGFGLVNDQGQWLKIPQLGGVTIGQRVEIGANTTIDRGALDDTLIEDGVKIDNLVQIAHNVQVGAHTAIAGCTGIAGSTKIGRHCLIGGAVGITDHVEIADMTIITAATTVSKSIKEPGGIFTSGVPMQARRDWERSAVHFRRLDKLAARIKALEQLND